MNLKIKRYIKSKKLKISQVLGVLFLVLIQAISSPLVTSAVTLKASVEFHVEAGERLKLRVAQIPTDYHWVDRDLEGNVLPPDLGDVIVSESFEDIYLGEGKYLPAGTKFYSKVVEVVEPKHFQKDGFVKLQFFKLEVNKQAQLLDDEHKVDYDTKPESTIGHKLKKIGTVGAYTAGGALAGAYLTYSIGGIAAVSDPYIVGGASALGATYGLASGIFKKGKLYNLEPGTELDLKLDNTWLGMFDADTEITAEKLALINQQKKLAKKNRPVDLKIKEVKKSKTVYGEKALAVTFDYLSKIKTDLRYSSFKLLDSMGKQYEPSPHKFEDDLFGNVPKEGELTLYYGVEFLNAPHSLQVIRWGDQANLGSADVVLGVDKPKKKKKWLLF